MCRKVTPIERNSFDCVFVGVYIWPVCIQNRALTKAHASHSTNYRISLAALETKPNCQILICQNEIKSNEATKNEHSVQLYFIIKFNKMNFLHYFFSIFFSGKNFVNRTRLQ